MSVQKIGTVVRWLSLGAVVLMIAAGAALAQDKVPDQSPGISHSTFSPGYRFVETTGEELYTNVCQGCHMPDGKGAAGAGTYPSLAGDAALATGAYPVTVVVNGSKAMPPVGAMMSDAQVAAVVNYVRSHFGNSYGDQVTVDDVKSARR